MGSQQVNPSALELIECSGLRRGQEPERRVERARLKACLRRGQRPLRPPRGIECQRDRALQERGRRGDPAASLRSAGRALQLGGDVLVEPRCRLSAVPGAAIRIDVGIGGLGERAVHAPALLRRASAVDRRTHERMTEAHLRAENN